ncbi:hypothetical protein SELMODRAFT_136708, partial [Selaginella moellendorffii]
EHIQYVDLMLQVLGANKLRSKVKKCLFFTSEVTSKRIMLNLKKTKAISNIQRPFNLTTLKSFIQIVKYYKRWIPYFAIVAKPLVTLLKKGQLYI